MDAVLLDTTVASFLHPAKSQSIGRTLYQRYLEMDSILICFQSVAELYCWADERRWGSRMRADLDFMLRHIIVVGYSTDLARNWARTKFQAKRAGLRLEAGDAWIAAAAIYMNVPLVTHDRDFARLQIPGLEVICHA